MTNPRVRGAAALIVLLLGSTAAAPAEAQDAAEDRFIAEGDVVLAIGEEPAPLDLDTCIDVALRSNDGLRQERQGLSELEARKVQARSEGFPVVELQGAWSRSRDPSFALDESFGGGEEGDDFFSILFPDTVDVAEFSFVPDPADIPAQTFWRTYLDAFWELRPTRVWRAVSAAEGAIEQQAALVRDAEHRTVEAVVGAYHAIVLARERLAAIEREIDAREEFLAVTRRRFRLEFATPLDTLQAAVSLSNLRPEARRRANDLRRAGQQLNLLLGRDPLTPVAVIASFPLEDEVVPAGTALALARHRPDLQAQRRESSLYELRRGVADAQNHPYLTVEGQWGFVTRELEDLTNDGQDFWRAGVTLHLPLFDGLRSRGEIQEAQAQLRRNEARVDELEGQVRDEVLDALEMLEIARADLTAASLNLDRANDAYTQISLRYELGKADNLEVLNAQAERFTARSTLIQARYDVLTSLATLKRAMGASPALPLASILAAADGGAPTNAQEESR
ncbi:MAG TPA: TolC family protein [Candidatus Krumholzibacteria bacterium]|nr:TolC family protein [Candidatus Krumholzibacteria bacterium]